MDVLANCATGCAAATSTPPKTGDACTLANNARCTFGSFQTGMLDTCRCQMNVWACTPVTIGMGAAGAGG
jgi:hypothetical protein